jgi:glutamate--cysteine ligase
MSGPEQLSDDELATRENLTALYRAAEKPRSRFSIGAESEKIGVFVADGGPLEYSGDRGVCRIFRHLEREHGWKPFAEVPGGPVLGLKRDRASITLEPGAQFELSGAPLPDLFAIAQEQQQHLDEVEPVCREMGLDFSTVGFQPLSRLDQLPWVPKQRYPIMREYLPPRGAGALDMMQRTATVQANFDWSSEADGMRKLIVALRLSPVIHALFANAPFKEGKVSGWASERGRVWLHMDPSRSGLIPSLFDATRGSYQDYVDWALGAGMFLFWRDGQAIHNTGQTFADFMANGHAGHRATVGDFRLHLTTLFPEVRLKNTLEVRSADSLGPELSLAVVALWTGILYDDRALEEAETLTRAFTHAEMQSLRPQLVKQGLVDVSLFGTPGFEFAERLLEAARSGLERRAATTGARSEAAFLRPIEALVAARTHPAARAIARAEELGSIVAATRLFGEAR